eukprot:scaffold54579_cov43-Phaeocystis_antarctica.AAC.2
MVAMHRVLETMRGLRAAKPGLLSACDEAERRTHDDHPADDVQRREDDRAVGWFVVDAIVGGGGVVHGRPGVDVAVPDGQRGGHREVEGRGPREVEQEVEADYARAQVCERREQRDDRRLLAREPGHVEAHVLLRW